ncbi:hypothetical protein CDD81_5359 [Ophiocordyceps australis]|uniref:Uncharacterized protein n=1 Tax=Ophiocordyceps australis TaxID=1399860 RepID=A0A2C5YAK8_9HYPO|nr:hypothetical protein CDD81_5359 [Ophiocordyceps australis]
MSISEYSHVSSGLLQWNYQCDLMPTVPVMTPYLHTQDYTATTGTSNFGERPLHSVYYLKLVPAAFADALSNSSAWPMVVSEMDRRDRNDPELIDVFGWLYTRRNHGYWICWSADYPQALLDYDFISDKLLGGFVSVDSVKHEYSGIALRQRTGQQGIGPNGACLHSSSAHYDEIRQLYKYVASHMPKSSGGIESSTLTQTRQLLQLYANPFVLAMANGCRGKHLCMHAQGCATVLGKGVATQPTSFSDYWEMLGLALTKTQNICITFSNVTLEKDYLYIDAGPQVG